MIAYIGLFSSALVAATILPMQSEAVLVGLLVAAAHPVSILILVATAVDTCFAFKTSAGFQVRSTSLSARRAGTGAMAGGPFWAVGFLSLVIR